VLVASGKPQLCGVCAQSVAGGLLGGLLAPEDGGDVLSVGEGVLSSVGVVFVGSVGLVVGDVDLDFPVPKCLGFAPSCAAGAATLDEVVGLV